MALGARRLALAANACTVALEAVAIPVALAHAGGLRSFTYYTQLANLWALASSVVYLVTALGRRPGAVRDQASMRRARTVRHVAASALTLTFVVVVFVLTPWVYASGGDGFHKMFVESSRMLTHLLCPALVVASYALWEEGPLLTWVDSQLFCVLTMLYALVAYLMNYLRVWDGPYPFFRVWDMAPGGIALWFCALVLVCEACGIAMCALARRSRRP